MIFNIQPDPELMGTEVKVGQVIGTAQDISKKYPGVTPHVHLRIFSLDPELLCCETPVY